MIQKVLDILDKCNQEDCKIIIKIMIEYYKFNYEEDIEIRKN